jgi:tRNA-2-methylthio-N6-dimethylallyladenosine synthase
VKQLPTVTTEQLSAQRTVIARIAARNLLLGEQLAYVDTYGCQQNEADSEHLRAMLSGMGYVLTEDETAANVIVINTCAVREHAEQRVLGNVGHLVHSAKAGRRIVLCGCMAQKPDTREVILRSYRQVDLMFGPHELWRFPELLERSLNAPDGTKIIEARDIDGEQVEGLPALRSKGERAWLSIMYGCNNFCSYCIVPYVRGRERSRSKAAITAEYESLAAEGYSEVMLLGQNVNSYPEFPGLLRTLAAIDRRVKLSFRTSHPKDAGTELFRAMADSPNVDTLLHLPVQAGNDRVLSAMNRKYTSAEYIAKIRQAREIVPGIRFSTDIIVGFPGETDAEFEDTLRLVEAVRYEKLFTFIYSPRKGTPAAELPDNASRAEKQIRFDKLIALQKSIAATL